MEDKDCTPPILRDIFQVLCKHTCATPGHFTDQEFRCVKELIQQGHIVVRYCGMMPHYYISNIAAVIGKYPRLSSILE